MTPALHCGNWQLDDCETYSKDTDKGQVRLVRLKRLKYESRSENDETEKQNAISDPPVHLKQVQETLT